MELDFRISRDSAGNFRFTKTEVLFEIKNGNVKFESGLLIRKSDNKIIGEFI